MTETKHEKRLIEEKIKHLYTLKGSKWNVSEFSKKIGVNRATMYNVYDNKAKPYLYDKIADELGILKEFLIDNNIKIVDFNKYLTNQDTKSNGRFVQNTDVIYLPFVSVSARAGFIENLHEGIVYPVETFPCLIMPGENLEGQIVFEVDGDSMEPNYTTKMKVRAKLVDYNDWAFTSSGVYIINYRNNYVALKRIKNNDILLKGMLTLHSDNEQTGGTLTLPKSEINHIWKVLRIVDAPAR